MKMRGTKGVQHLTSKVGTRLFHGIKLRLEELEVFLIVLDLETQLHQFLLHCLQHIPKST
jgi:hypothetical protein